MKVTTTAKPIEPQFEPITLTIVCETPEEAHILRRIAGMNHAVVEALREGGNSGYAIDKIPAGEIARVLKEAFSPVEKALRAQNIPL